MTRADAIARAFEMFDGGRFAELLARRVAIPTECQEPGREDEMRRYLDEELRPELEGVGATVEILPNPSSGAAAAPSGVRISSGNGKHIVENGSA